MMNQTPPINNQDAFDRVWETFVVKGAPPCAVMDDIGTTQCLYRNGEHGCHIGIMIPDQMVQELELEGDIETCLEDCGLEFNNWFANCDTEFLMRLQYVHDANMFFDGEPSEPYFGPHYISDMEELADNYGLKIPKMESA